MGKFGDRLKRRYAEAKGETPATTGDLKRLRHEMDRGFARLDSGRQPLAGRAVRMINKGFRNIGTSMNTPYDNRRPKISQLPARRSDMGISLGANLEKMKMPGLRGTNIRGKKKGNRKSKGGFVLG